MASFLLVFDGLFGIEPLLKTVENDFFVLNMCFYGITEFLCYRFEK